MNLKFSANLSMLFPEYPFLERFDRAAQSGFCAVEFLFPYDAGVEAVAQKIESLDLTVVLFNLHAGDMEKREWGTLSNPRRRDYFRWSFETALQAAGRLGCHRLNMMFGERVAGLDAEDQVKCAVENLRWAAPQADQAGVDLLIEPLNAFDFPHYFLQCTDQALQVIRAVNHSRVGLQYDVYHSQRTEGNLINTITLSIDVIRHIQIADVPGRHQPGTGEIHYPAIFVALEDLDYEGYIGLEYNPLGSTEDSLNWVADLNASSATGESL